MMDAGRVNLETLAVPGCGFGEFSAKVITWLAALAAFGMSLSATLMWTLPISRFGRGVS